MTTDPVRAIKERLDIVEEISRHVTLKQAGRNFKGLCPFHGEKTPSFIVFPATQGYHCFGCGQSGDVFSFAMAIQKADFRDVLHQYASQVGIELKPPSPEAEEEDRQRQRLVEANAAAALFYQNLLATGQAGRSGRTYLTERGISMETAERFQLGYAPDTGNALIGYLAGKGFEIGELRAAGLTVEIEGGSDRDRFRGRLIFPIRDRSGKVLGFGGRALGDRQPKYLNSPQTTLFDKSSILYGLDQAADPIRQQDEAVIVEGYIDVITAHQAGYRNVVAPMGTALTERQVGALKRLSKNLVLALDADTAGDLATVRGLQVVREGLDRKLVAVPTWRGLVRLERRLDGSIRVLRLPRGQDPDEIIRQDKEAWRKLAETALPVVDFYLGLLPEKYDLGAARGKAQAVEEMAPILAEMADPVEKAHYVARLAEVLHLEERAIRDGLQRARRQQQRWQEGPGAPPEPPRSVGSLEDYVLGLLLRYPSAARQPDAPAAEDFHTTEARLVLEALKTAVGADGMLDQDRMRDAVGDELEAYLHHLMDLSWLEPELFEYQVSEELAARLQRLREGSHLRVLEEVEVLLREAQAAEDTADLQDLRGLLDRASQAFHERIRFSPRPSPIFRDSRDS